MKISNVSNAEKYCGDYLCILVNARSGRKWTESGPVTSPIWTGPIRTESVTPYLSSLDLCLLGYRGQKCHLHALTIQRCKIFIPPHSVTISELQLTTTDVHLPGTADTVVSSYRYVTSKTQAIWLGHKNQIDRITIRSVPVLSLSVSVVDSARDLGVVIDSRLTMSDQVTALCRAGYYQLRQLRPVARALPEAAAKTLVQAVSYTHLTLPTIYSV